MARYDLYRLLTTTFIANVILFDLQHKAAPKSRAKKEEKVYLEIDAHFERPQRGGRGRGGDRGDRPRGGRGGRGGRARGAANGSSSTPALDVADETAFPSLA